MGHSLALYFLAFGALLLVAVLLDDLAARVRVPGILMVLILGLLVDNHLTVTSDAADAIPPLLSLVHADQITQAALVLVLFFGGLTTNWAAMRSVIPSALRLATFGALFTALLITLAMLAFGVAEGSAGWVVLFPQALFVGAMLSSTDASATFALLRPLAGRLPKPVLDLIETESGFNDPVAVVLAGVAMALAGGEGVAPAALVTEVLRQFLLGILLGFLGGSLTTQVLGSRRSLNTNSMLPVVSLALLMVLAGGTTLMGGSALLAAYVAGLVLGNGSSTDQLVLEQAHASFAKMAELLLFLCMGLVVSPEDVVRSAGGALLLFLLVQVVRWLIVHSLLLRSSFSLGQRTFVCCAGLRGAVPIALAIQVWASSSVSWGKTMPPLALAVVLFGLLFQGFALVPIANRLGLASRVEAPLSAL
ncbi:MULTISPECIES: cation:proton antiporter [Prochlorococcus]|uniref:cation:proton antiporter domain-containing protein n=1 Tax=Prochlorococcus TaxID=1218 RepID=UPI0007B39F04|nr:MULTISPECIES: cation:proton antiporter [Prochlorococcus]KZR79024.1 K(+)/H(+) antiporter NhaP [Prochlorococcus marinus str. MIT 1327]NMO85391.1 sodium:proton antiporter [Prochlorococcus sp. P1344]NMP05393.1 sodium:proton antiporter [Prochlorococcus sp. P1361]KZR63870.1 K(+)/H(+) antiporter NhaP [Prochlorococcus marinus str. MIT 1312]NMP13829.1 sodium:proton antiporter [Prochlorococcus sp.P1363]